MSIFVSTLIAVALVGFFVFLVTKVSSNPEKRCIESGGIWSAGRECIVEDPRATIRVPELTVHIPEGETLVRFADIEMGSSSAAYGMEFIGNEGIEGSVTLLQNFGRIEPSSEDLIMPFVVSYGGTGMFYYLGVFEKVPGGYRQRDAALVGDRIFAEETTLAASGTDTYTVRFRYRDRAEGQPFSVSPTEERTMEATIYNHMIDRLFTVGDGMVLYNDLVKLRTPQPGDTITSPVSITGFARGQWFFEASFPVRVVDWDGKIIGEGHAQAEGEWMTTDFVPFTATLTYSVSEPLPYDHATLILSKDNPSGLPEHDDALEIPVVLGN